MILLDTNVISEIMRREPAATVLRWVNARSAASLFVASVTQAEILYGILQLPKGKRRTAIADAADAMFDRDFEGRVLAFDGDAAKAYATIAADRRRTGRPISSFDAQIAAIARVNGARLATRNVDDFAGCGIDVTNPWTAGT